MPKALFPEGTAWTSAATDVVVMAAALAVAAVLVFQVRSKRWLRVAGVAALAWFGFWRKGCLCPMGPVQSVAAALAGLPDAGLTVSAALLFLLPLAAALLFGRVYCAAVCPHGALQDLLVVHPVRVPPWLDALLRFGRWVFFAAVLLFAASGAGWLLCRLDPYVVFFRRAGPPAAVFGGVAFLAVGAFVVRPYCRFMCPYGLLLGLLSRLAWRSPVVTPQECIRCRLCERSCPVEAIEPPETPPEGLVDRNAARRRLARLLLLVPPVVALGAGAGLALAPALARLHPDAVRLRTAAHHQQAGAPEPGSRADYVIDAIEDEGLTMADLETAAAVAARRFRILTPWAGGGLALAVMLRLVSLARLRRSPSYDIDPGDCVGCGRCFDACPLNRPRPAAPNP